MSEEIKEDFHTPDIAKREGMPLFDCVNVIDPRLNCTSSIPFGVNKSGSNVPAYKVAAASATSTGVQFLCQIPTLSTVVDRHFEIESIVYVTVAYNPSQNNFVLGDDAAGAAIAQYGKSWALAPFPFHHMCQNITVGINTTSINVNMQEFLPQLMRILDKEVLEQSCLECPTRQDFYQSYASGLAQQNNVLGSAEAWNTNGLPPRGSYEVAMLQSDGVTSGESAAGAAAGATTRTATIQIKIREPLLVSPFLVGRSENSQGFYGIQNLNIQCNFANSACRAIRASLLNNSAVTAVNSQVVAVDKGATFLHFMLLTPPIGTRFSLPSRNIVPYMQPLIQKTTLGTTLANGATQTFTSANIQLHQVPDYSRSRRFPTD